MAPSFFSLPPELRLQIYRRLLCHHTRIWIQPHGGRDTITFSPECAILRTCRRVYSEAMPVLYGENTFRYSCPTRKRRVRIPDARLKYTKHLEVEICPDAEVAVKIILIMLERLIKCGCELQTFELFEEGRDAITLGLFDHSYCPWRKIAASRRVMAAFNKLRISQTLTFSIWSFKTKCDIDRKSITGLEDVIQTFMSGLASQKGMHGTLMEPPHKYRYPSSAIYDVYRLKWCLGPQQSIKTADTILG